MKNPPTITVRNYYSEEYKCRMYVASGPGAEDMLARTSEQTALEDGLAYFLRTRFLDKNGEWKLI